MPGYSGTAFFVGLGVWAQGHIAIWRAYGDVVKRYNDGPPEPNAKPLGPFYELQTASPDAARAPGESLMHHHQTFHVQGSEAVLDAPALHTLGVSIETVIVSIKAALHD